MTSSPRKTISLGRAVQSLQRVPDEQGPQPCGSEGMPAAPEADGHVPHTQAEYERGLAAGREEAQRQTQALQQALRQATTNLQTQARDLQKALDRYVTHLALRIASQVIGREVKDGATVQQMLATLLAQVPVRQGLRLRLNPADLAQLEALRGAALVATLGLPDDAVLVADESIGRGGCLVESVVGQIDARVETQLQLIEQALNGEADDKAHA